MALRHLTETEIASILVIGVVVGLVVYSQSDVVGMALLTNSLVAALIALVAATGGLLLIKRVGEDAEATSIRGS